VRFLYRLIDRPPPVDEASAAAPTGSLLVATLLMYRAYAKINLGLRILNKRPDNYHNIETVFHRIDLYDELTFSASSTVSIASSSPDAPSDETNICSKAAQMLKDVLGFDGGVHIAIRKNIPVGAGLGGGSSDAATVLRELPRFWGKTLDARTVQKIALELGSDVPYFLQPGTAYATGRGNVLDFFFLEMPYTILVCYPHIHVSTAWAYQNVRPKNRSEGNLKQILISTLGAPQKLVAMVKNDFETTVVHTYPAIGDVKEDMLRGGAVFALLSGSGSSVFGLFKNPGAAGNVAENLRSRGYATYITPAHFTLPSDQSQVDSRY
jgi:4-diphosphocytidyl-2-C-methyl-D-erythritol kinase